MMEIRQAKKVDEAAILAFLDTHWQKGHVFVRHPELLRWQHQDPDDAEALTFVLALRDGELLGLLGFIPFRRFDPAADWKDLALAVWKVRDDAAAPGLGLQLLNTVKRIRRPDLICAVGISDMVVPIYRALGYTVGPMAHAALFPEIGPDGPAGGVPDVAREHASGAGKLTITRKLPENLPPVASRPRKSLDYLRARYAEHPWYEYQFAHNDDALLVLRKVDSPKGAVLRIVDLVGDAGALASCTPALRALTREQECAYLDLVHYGVPDEALPGWVEVREHAELVLPNYFEPFEQRNVPLRMAFKAGAGSLPIRLLRGDTDQDRPNRL
ncbi:MAG: hypothetical protein JJ896_15560 [Rhodothermales bacterium]|nr:hypothetical protein [Rhodothermales bacterium]MBO6781072.1 hypothetical protein [Rhodothermales bacterium]